MPKTRPPYPPDLRRQMVELVGSGRSIEELAGEFEPSTQAIRNWVGRADRDDGRLRREKRQLKLGRDIFAKAAAWFARETNSVPSKGSGS